MAASGSDAKGRDSGRAERAVPRRGTIVVSPTQLVPEVLAVWGSDYGSEFLTSPIPKIKLNHQFRK